MKKSDKYSVVCLVACIVLLIFAVLVGVKREYTAYLLAGFSLVGLIACYFIHFAVHELGHLIFAKLAGMKCLYFEISGLVVDKTSAKTKFYHRYSPEGGEITVYGKNPSSSSRDLSLTAFGGVLFSVLFIGLCIFFGLYYENVYCFSVLFVGSCSSIFIFLLNLNPFSQDSDGVSLIFRCGNSFKERAKCQEIFTRLVHGEDITAMNESLFEGESYDIKGYSALRKACLGEVEEAKRIYDSILSDSGYSNPVVFEERFYLALVQKDGNFIEKNCEMATAYLFLENSPASLRIQSALRDYQGDGHWSELLRKSAKKELETYSVKGMISAEEKLNDLYFGEKDNKESQ